MVPNRKNLDVAHQLKTHEVVVKVADCLEAYLFLQEEIFLGNCSVVSIKDNVSDWLSMYMRVMCHKFTNAEEKLGYNATTLVELVNKELDLLDCVVWENR